MPAALTDDYALLGIERDADLAQIKRAFKLRARQVHPDISADPDATRQFVELQAAYERLLEAGGVAIVAARPETRADPLERDGFSFKEFVARSKRERPTTRGHPRVLSEDGNSGVWWGRTRRQSSLSGGMWGGWGAMETRGVQWAENMSQARRAAFFWYAPRRTIASWPTGGSD